MTAVPPEPSAKPGVTTIWCKLTHPIMLGESADHPGPELVDAMKYITMHCDEGFELQPGLTGFVGYVHARSDLDIQQAVYQMEMSIWSLAEHHVLAHNSGHFFPTIDGGFRVEFTEL